MTAESWTPLRLAEHIAGLATGHARFVVAIAGPPGAGKSTWAGRLVDELNRKEPRAVLVGMDGYHYDNRVLIERGLLERKGAPETFDVEGLLADLRRIAAARVAVAVPVFDRTADLARAAAAVVPADRQIILVEGNYLLLDEPAWRDLAALVDWSVFLAVPNAELENRLVRRWLDHGLSPKAAKNRARANDMANADIVNARSLPADLVVKYEPG